MPLLRTLIWKAARHLANDPRMQEIAADAYAKARPKVEETARQIRDAAREKAAAAVRQSSERKRS